MKNSCSEAGRLLGWLHSPQDVETELGYSPEDAKRFFASTRLLEPKNVRLLVGESDVEGDAA